MLNKNEEKEKMDKKISLLASLQTFNTSQNLLENNLNRLLKGEEKIKGLTKNLEEYWRNKEILGSDFENETLNTLLRIAKESSESKLVKLKKESSDEEFKLIVKLLHLFGKCLKEENYSQVFGLIIEHIDTEINEEIVRLQDKLANLKKYCESFDPQDDSSYTFIFADVFVQGLAIFFSTYELERSINIFSNNGNPISFYFN